jgi:WD40 repeat protein
VAFSSNNKYIISGSFDRTIRLWNLEGKNLRTIELAKEPFHLKEEVWSVKSVAFSSDSKYIVAGISTAEYDFSGIVQLLDIKGNPKGQPFGSDWRFALSPNGKYIAVGDANNTIQLWDMKGNRIGSPFRGHENSITSLAFSPNGRFIASGSWDNTVRLWDIQGNLISTFLGHQKAIESITFSPDGRYIASASQDGIVRLWPSNWKTALEVACNRLKHHPVLTNSKTDEEKSAARTCLSYGRMDL